MFENPEERLPQSYDNFTLDGHSYSPETPHTIHAGVPSDDKKNIVELLLKECETIINNLKHLLRGERKVKNPENNEWIWEKDPHSNPLINEKGLHSLMIFVESALNPNVICSSFGPDEIRKWTLTVTERVSDQIFKSYNEYEIKKSNMSTVVFLIEFAVKSTLNRAQEGTTGMGMTASIIQNMSQIREVQSIQQQMIPQQSPTSWRDRFNPFGLFNRR